MELNELIAEYELGDKAKDFLNSDLGQYLVGCAYQEIEAFRDKLEETIDSEKYLIIQTKIKARRLAIEWITAAINTGENAGATIQSINSED